MFPTSGGISTIQLIPDDKAPQIRLKITGLARTGADEPLLLNQNMIGMLVGIHPQLPSLLEKLFDAALLRMVLAVNRSGGVNVELYLHSRDTAEDAFIACLATVLKLTGRSPVTPDDLEMAVREQIKDDPDDTVKRRAAWRSVFSSKLIAAINIFLLQP